MRPIILKKLTIISCLCSLLLLMGCYKNDHEELISLASYNSIVSLNELSIEISDLLSYIEKKDYIKATETIFKIHESWDTFYPYGYVAGLKPEATRYFIKDLNATSSLILQHGHQQKEEEIQIKAKKAKYLLEQNKSSDSESSESGSAKRNDDSWDDNSGKKNDMEMINENKLDYQNNSFINSKGFEAVDQILLPEEVLRYTYPELNFDKKDAEAYESAVELSRHIASFYSIVHEPKESILLKIKYLFQGIIASSLLEDADGAMKRYDELMATWEENRLIYSSDNEELVIKIDQNLKELLAILKSSDQQLIKIKCKIGIRNLDELINQ